MVEASTFFPFFLSPLVAIASVDISITCFGVTSLGVAMGKMLVVVIPKFYEMAFVAKYQMGTAKVIFGNFSVAKTWCETKLGGGNKKGVWVIEYAKKAGSRTTLLLVYKTGS